MTQNAGDDGWRGFLSLCRRAKSVEQLDELLWLYLTPEERDDIARRHLIIRELIRGKKTQREMAKDLNVSIAKITRGSNFLKTIQNDLRRLLQDIS